jgi:hypothetical protein
MQSEPQPSKTINRNYIISDGQFEAEQRKGCEIELKEILAGFHTQMPWAKHRGKPLVRVPGHYLR